MMTPQSTTVAIPTFLQSGFRLLFFCATVIAVISMFVWLLLTNDTIQTQSIPSNYWHAHEIIFGYVMAVVVGFLLTAVKNWTKIQALYGYPLLGLGVLWFCGRFLIIVDYKYLLYQAIIDISFLIIATLLITYPIIKAKNWTNVPILAKLLLFSVAHIIFYLGLFKIVNNGALIGIYLSFYLVLSLILMMIRRLIPFFIENGVQATTSLKNSKILDIASMVLFVVFIIFEIFMDDITSIILAALLFVIHGMRMINWYHHHIWQKPLLWSLYIAYGLITLAFALIVVDYFVPLPANMATHSFAFGIGFVTLSMMSRVSLGHTGRNVFTPSKYLNTMFLLLFLSFVFRVVFIIFFVEYYALFIMTSQILWIFAFMLFLIIYTPMFFQKRLDGVFG